MTGWDNLSFKGRPCLLTDLLSDKIQFLNEKPALLRQGAMEGRCGTECFRTFLISEQCVQKRVDTMHTCGTSHHVLRLMMEESITGIRTIGERWLQSF